MRHGGLKEDEENVSRAIDQVQFSENGGNQTSNIDLKQVIESLTGITARK